jgi:formate dehydrogenase beta subunit
VEFAARPVGAEWFDANVPCTRACPVLTLAGRYVSAIAAGDDELAYKIARLPNPFPSICGRVCAAPCEVACRRGTIDEPIAIRALKRFVTERYGVESGHGDEIYRTAAPTAPPRGERVAVIGAGPAGLACAHDLATFGYRPVVFDAADRPGGQMVLSIPSYRLRRDLLQNEIRAILGMGVELRANQALGRDFTLSSLKEDGFEAIFLGVGAMRGRDLNIPGNDKDGVLKAIDFLLNANMGYEVNLGKEVLVIGGGNVALDAARTAIREAAQGITTDEAARSAAEEAGTASTAVLDVARTAVRLGSRVRVVSLENRQEMPAHEFEIEEAEVEGIQFLHRLGPKAILGNGGVTGLEVLDVSSVFDEDGRFNPKTVEGTEQTITCDTVIIAIGQAPDLSWLEEGDGVDVSPRGTIAIEPQTLATSAPGIYAGGDVAFGPRNLIDAIADGRRAAASMHRQITGQEPPRPVIDGRKMLPIVAVNRGRQAFTYTERDRVVIPAEPTGRRIGSPEVELGYTEAEARAEAGRCLQCFLNINLDTTKCILCRGCADVCPERCISIVPVDQLEGVQSGVPASALVIQEDRCIRCALCVDRCPTKALSLDAWSEASSAPIALEPVGN